MSLFLEQRLHGSRQVEENGEWSPLRQDKVFGLQRWKTKDYDGPACEHLYIHGITLNIKI